MRFLLVQIALSVIILQSESVLSIDFYGSRAIIALTGFNQLVLLTPLFFISSPVQGASSNKSKRRIKSHDEGSEDTAEMEESSLTSGVNRIVEDLKEKAKRAQDANERNKKRTSSKGKISPQDDMEMDPMKCFPKALCGVSSEVAQISKRQKNGLITDYLLLMKAIARNPSVVDEAAAPLLKIKKSKTKGKTPSSSLNDEEVLDDIGQTDDEDASNSEEEEDDEGNDSIEDEEDGDDESAQDDEPAAKSDKKKKKKRLSPDDKLHVEYLREKVEMDNLYKETVNKEAWNDDNWWGSYGDDSPSMKKKPWSGSSSGPSSGGRPPYYRREKPNGDGGPTSGGGVTSLFSNWFGNLQRSSGEQGFPFFGMGREFPLDASSGIGMDETKEILATAVEIGKGFDRPSQCNEIFNGCNYDYTELLYMIDDMRQILRQKTSKRKKGSKEAKTGVEDALQKSTNDDNAQPGLRTSKKASKQRNKKNKRLERLPFRPVTPNYPERIVIPNSHEQHSQSSGESSSPGFSISNAFSSWLG